MGHSCGKTAVVLLPANTVFFPVKSIGKTAILPVLTYDGGAVNVIKTSNCSGPGAQKSQSSSSSHAIDGFSS